MTLYIVYDAKGSRLCGGHEELANAEQCLRECQASPAAKKPLEIRTKEIASNSSRVVGEPEASVS